MVEPIIKVHVTYEQREALEVLVQRRINELYRQRKGHSTEYAMLCDLKNELNQAGT